MKQFIADRHTTPGTPAMDPIGEPAIPLYASEQDLLDDLANLEVGQIAGTIDPAESELIGVLIQKIQALENGEKYSTEEVKTNKKWWNGTEWKDVYRKRFDLYHPNANLVLVTNVEDIVDCGGTFLDADNNQWNFPCNSITSPNGRRILRIDSSNNLILSCDYNNQTYKIWAEYTKTSA